MSLSKRHPEEIVTQRELADLLSINRAYRRGAANIEARLAAGAWISPGSLSFESGEVVEYERKRRIDRLRMIGRMLEHDEYEVLSKHPKCKRKLMEARQRYLKVELNALWTETKGALSSRAVYISAARRWDAYPALTISVASAYIAILKLRVASRLLSWERCGLINIKSNIGVLARYFLLETYFEGMPS